MGDLDLEMLAPYIPMDDDFQLHVPSSLDPFPSGPQSGSDINSLFQQSPSRPPSASSSTGSVKSEPSSCVPSPLHLLQEVSSIFATPFDEASQAFENTPKTAIPLAKRCVFSSVSWNHEIIMTEHVDVYQTWLCLRSYFPECKWKTGSFRKTSRVSRIPSGRGNWRLLPCLRLLGW